VPEPFRSTVILRDIEGFVYEEVAEMLGVNLGTVKSRLMRGRACLKKLLVASNAERSDTARAAQAQHEQAGLERTGLERLGREWAGQEWANRELPRQEWEAQG